MSKAGPKTSQVCQKEGTSGSTLPDVVKRIRLRQTLKGCGTSVHSVQCVYQTGYRYMYCCNLKSVVQTTRQQILPHVIELGHPSHRHVTIRDSIPERHDLSMMTRSTRMSIVECSQIRPLDKTRQFNASDSIVPRVYRLQDGHFALSDAQCTQHNSRLPKR